MGWFKKTKKVETRNHFVEHVETTGARTAQVEHVRQSSVEWAREECQTGHRAGRPQFKDQVALAA